METLLQDSKYALRQLRKSPGFTSLAVVMLALGIGSTTAVFSVVEGVLLRPLPFRAAGRLVAVTEKLQGVEDEERLTAPDIRAYTRDVHAFESVGGYQPTGYELSGAGEPSQVNAARLGAGVFPTLGVAPVLGRVFTRQEDDDGQQVAVLSYALWQIRFHGDPHVLGSNFWLDRKPYSVIGVMPRNFEFPLLPGHLNRSELWVPLSLTKTELTRAAFWEFQMVARLKPGMTPAQAEADAGRVGREIMRNYPAYMASWHISAVVRPLQEDTVRQARPLVGTLFLAVAVVLLIACANLAGLLLVRAIRRRREFAIRLAMGASSGALLRQAILESLTLSLSGGLLGIVLAAMTIRVSINLLPETLPRIGEIGLSWPVIAFALFLGITTGVLCGLAPAFAAIRTNLNETLKEGGRTGYAGGGLARLRSSLVVAEISIALVLLTASGLLLRSFERMRAVDVGFRPEHVVIAGYTLPQRQYASQAAVDEFNDELLRRLRQLPGAGSAGLTSVLPTSGSRNSLALIAEGFVPPKGTNMSLACVSLTQGDFFRAMGIPLLRGRFFTESDKAGAPLVVIVNRKLAEHYWPGQDPIGKRLRVGTPEMQTPWLTIVGKVADVKQGAPDVDTQEQYYEPVGQWEASIGSLGSPDNINGNGGFITLRAALPPEQMENALRSTIRSLDRQLALTQVQTMERAVSDSEAPRRFNTAVITAFAVGSVLLAVLGIYSVIAFSVALRVHEIAIRMALGSQRVGIIGLILGSGARLAAAGCGIGFLGAWGASRLLRSFLFQVDPLDPLVLALAVATIFLLALAASVFPAGRATSIDPMQALRME